MHGTWTHERGAARRNDCSANPRLYRVTLMTNYSVCASRDTIRRLESCYICLLRIMSGFVMAEIGL